MVEHIKVLYQDKYVIITEQYILAKKYYVPLMTSKTMMFTDIQEISIEDGSKVTNSWGISTYYLNNWFQYHPDKKNRDRFLSIKLKNRRVRPAVIPENANLAFTILKNHFAEIERRSVVFQGGQTDLDREQARQMMKQQDELEKCKEIKIRKKQKLQKSNKDPLPQTEYSESSITQPCKPKQGFKQNA